MVASAWVVALSISAMLAYPETNHASLLPEVASMPIQLSGDLASVKARAQAVSLASWAAPLPTLTSSRMMRITFGGPGGWSCACVTEGRETNRDTTAKRNRVFFTVFNLLF